jgi:tRNA A-37 threonylcarbamoyl transferase component Bud32
MNNDYEAFCIADRRFYDTPTSGKTADDYAIVGREVADGWVRTLNDHWAMHAPKGADLPSQGWKIHVSSCVDNSEDVIQVIHDYSIARGLAFKYLRGPRVMLARNAKYAARGGSGKLVTVYPRDEAELEVTCKDLEQALAGEPGPYILSDLRIGAGPVHVRYGGFTPRNTVDDSGEVVPAIEDPTGALVPDVRGPVFAVPEWVTPPEFLAPHLAARRATTVAEIPYRITRALHFSNGGGVYAGTDERTGGEVVLKEARPHAGLDAEGTDAVTRLRRERDVLERLAGVEGVPRLLDHLVVGEHEFVVMEMIEGEPLKAALARRCPILGSSLDEGELADYARWALDVHAQVERTVAAIHERGVVYGDLHTFNVMVRPDGRVALIDFEVAADAEGGGRPGIGAVGFTAPRDRHGVDIDLYALACLRLALFLPLAPLLGLERAKAADLADAVAETFPVPREWLDEAVLVVTGPAGGSSRPSGAARPSGTGTPSGSLGGRPRLEPDQAGWRRARASITRAILASATPERDDRLFPGDVAQFHTGGLNLAHGAAGVLYALDATGGGRHPRHEDWLARRVAEPDERSRLGLYDGLAGIAVVLGRLGYRDEAARAIEMCLGDRWESSGDDLYGGVAGLGLAFADRADATGEPALHDAARRATELVVERLGSIDDVGTVSGGDQPYAGLMRGSAGRALLLVRMYERTGEAGLLDHAATALRQDLRRCVERGPSEPGPPALHVDEGWRVMPYLAAGSAGIGLVLHRYLAHRDDEAFAAAARAIREAAKAVFYVQPSLFGGRAGTLMLLADRDVADGPPAGGPGDDVAAQVRRLGWHALTYEGELAFPGDQLLRLSMDLATGSAGVLLALGAALHGEPVHLPFLGPAGPVAPAGAGGPDRPATGRR